MAKLSFVAFLAPFALACAPSAPSAHPAPVQQPIERACPADARPMEELGLAARTVFSGDAQAKVVVTNLGAAPRRVAPRIVALCRGACSGKWGRCSDSRKFDASEQSRYDVSLEPGESIELLVDARVRDLRHSCEKAALFVFLAVDGVSACGDAGVWIALAPET
jgi:hypothetical protein